MQGTCIQQSGPRECVVQPFSNAFLCQESNKWVGCAQAFHNPLLRKAQALHNPQQANRQMNHTAQEC